MYYFWLSPEGPTPNGMIAIGICVVVLLIISYFGCKAANEKKAAPKANVKVEA